MGNEMQENPFLFELKYGNEYIEKIYYGKNIFVIGALRNMPTNDKAATEIKDIARKHMNGLIDKWGKPTKQRRIGNTGKSMV